MKLPPFPISTTPFRDESLAGFVARACARNGYDCLHAALRDVTKAHLLAYARDIDFKHLAYRIGCDELELEKRHHQVMIKRSPARTGYDNFLGSPVRPRIRIASVRRFSPSALKISAHHRAGWNLKTFMYCYETGDALIETCPNCLRKLSWRRTNGIEFCEFCVNEDFDPVVDLRNVTVPDRLSDDQLTLYRNIARLIVPSETPSTIAPPELKEWEDWEIFELIITLATILQWGISKRYTWDDRLHLQHVKTQWHQCLMAAGSAVAAWPNGLLDVIDQLMSHNASSGQVLTSRISWIGPLMRPHDYTTHNKIRVTIDRAVDRFYPPVRRGAAPWSERIRTLQTSGGEVREFSGPQLWAQIRQSHGATLRKARKRDMAD